MTPEAHRLPSFETQPIDLLPDWARRSMIAAAVLLTLLLLVLALFDFSRSVRAPGWITPQGGVIRLMARSSGRVGSYSVQEGDTVAAGQAIVQLSGSVDPSDRRRALSDALYGDRIAAARDRLTSRLASTEAQRRQIAAEMDTLQTEAMGLRNQVAIISRRLALRRDALSRVQRLQESGFASQTLVTLREADVMAEEQSAAIVAGSLARIEALLVEKRLLQRALASERDGAESDWRGEDASLLQLRYAADEESQQQYRADIPATVISLPVPSAQIVPAGAILAVLAPTGRPLEAELMLPSSAAAHVIVGQKVHLQFEAFPTDRTEGATGSVTYVSPAVLAPADLSTPGRPVDQPVIRVRVRLTKQQIRSGNRTYSLTPGMVVTGVVELERRSLIDVLTASLVEGFR